METSAPKRRRISPRTAVAVQPDTESTTPRDGPPQAGAASSRPSFASPTRASLERYNSDILRRRESQPRRLRSSPDTPASPSRALTPDSTGGLTRALRTQLELRSGVRDGGAPVGSETGGVLRSPARRLGRATTRPTPRPLPPPAPEHDEELLRAITGRTVPGTSLGVLPEVAVDEPALPPTPEYPDPVVSTPPSGIHNTPSRRPKRSRALAERLQSSSPLKSSPLRPKGLPQKGIPLDLGQSSKKPRPADPAPLAAPTAAELRGLKPKDPDEEKKKLRDSLLAELGKLQHDLDLASTENERIRQAQLSRHIPTPPVNKDEILDVLSRHILPSEEPLTKPDPGADWLASALNPIAFLPFSKPSPSGPPSLTPPANTAITEPESPPPPISHHPLPMTADEALPYLQVFTPLTFTSHISPLPRTTTTNDDDDGPLLQHHSITASSTSPRGLFTARIEMTVNTKTMAVSSLAVPRLDPAAAAELRPFVERAVGKQPSTSSSSSSSPDGSSSSSGLHNNVSVLAWAMGEWLRVAVKRAQVWIALEREAGAGAGKAALREMVARLRAGQRARRSRGRRRGRRRNWVEEEVSEGEDDAVGGGGGGGVEGGRGEDEDGDGEGGADGDETRKYEAADLLPFMGRTCMDLEVPVLEGKEGDTAALRVQWRIAFDWTGEARSDIGVLIGIPGKWHKHDERGQLSGLPKMFDELIRGGEEPLDAVRTIVCLLAGEQRS